MSKRLILMRHADSPRELEGKGSDYQRPLSDTGLSQATEMSTFLKEKDWIPDLIIVSSAKRTRQTAEVLVKELGLNPDCITALTSLYAAPAKKIFDEVRSAILEDGIGTVLVLGHNPGISDLAMECDPEKQAHYFSPAGLAGFELKEEAEWNFFTQDDAYCCFSHEPKPR